MNIIVSHPPKIINSQMPSEVRTTSQLDDRFILTQVQSSTLIFPSIWVAEILRIDRSSVLSLPIYSPLLLGIIDINGQIIPLINTDRLLASTHSPVGERLVVVRLNQGLKGLENVGLIVDRLIGDTTRDKLPSDLFTTDRFDEMVMMKSALIPANLWQPQASSINN